MAPAPIEQFVSGASGTQPMPNTSAGSYAPTGSPSGVQANAYGAPTEEMDPFYQPGSSAVSSGSSYQGIPYDTSTGLVDPSWLAANGYTGLGQTPPMTLQQLEALENFDNPSGISPSAARGGHMSRRRMKGYAIGGPAPVMPTGSPMTRPMGTPMTAPMQQRPSMMPFGAGALGALQRAA